MIGERGEDDNYRFWGAYAQTDASGNIYVLDAGNHRVQLFDPAGKYVRTLGREGQGPGEFALPPRVLIVAGDRVIVMDTGDRRFSAWTLDGEPIGDFTLDSRWTPWSMFGFDDGTFLGEFVARRDDDAVTGYSVRLRLSTYGTDYQQLAFVQEFPPLPLPAISRVTATSVGSLRLRLPVSVPLRAAAHSGEIYTSRGEEYQAHAFAHEATPRWALRVAWPRLPIRDAGIEAAMDRARERIPDATRSEVYIPAANPAISHIAVDGHGHLYVLPYIDEATAEARPVDVYAADGERLFSGWMANMRWDDARGDFVYGRESDDDTGEERVIRYRLVEPFEGQSP